MATVAGCGKKSAATNTPTLPKQTVDTRTAKGAAIVALSSLPTSAPNPKLLLCQTVAPIAATMTPIWQFLVGSPKTNEAFSVLVNGGVAQKRSMGKLAMKPEEWAKVPTLKDWAIDSDIARLNALNVYPNGQNASYLSSFMTYRSEAATHAISPPMTWAINFDPRSMPKGDTTTTVYVDMRTGAARFAK
jgi:hypothetical protein